MSQEGKFAILGCCWLTTLTQPGAIADVLGDKDLIERDGFRYQQAGELILRVFKDKAEVEKLGPPPCLLRHE